MILPLNCIGTEVEMELKLSDQKAIIEQNGNLPAYFSAKQVLVFFSA